MKEGENMKLIKRITAYLLTFSILLSIGSSVVAAAVAPVEQEYPAHEDPSQEMLTDLEQKGVQINHVKDSSLITNIKNPSNGKLSFTIKIPANQTPVSYTHLLPGFRRAAVCGKAALPPAERRPAGGAGAVGGAMGTGTQKWRRRFTRLLRLQSFYPIFG